MLNLYFLDQVTSLPGDVCVSEVQTLVASKDNLSFVKDCKVEACHDGKFLCHFV